MKGLNNSPIYTISNAAKILNVSVHTLRMYEREGLLLPFRKESNQRLYSNKDLERVICIQNTINKDKINIEAIRRMLALLPCWTIIKCSDEDKKNCEYYSTYAKPCWMINHNSDICRDKDCCECEIYNSFGSCDSIKKKLKELLP
jgi:MerR family transcriptional regulator/heat shock protein HspR